MKQPPQTFRIADHPQATPPAPGPGSGDDVDLDHALRSLDLAFQRRIASMEATIDRCRERIGALESQLAAEQKAHREEVRQLERDARDATAEVMHRAREHLDPGEM